MYCYVTILQYKSFHIDNINFVVYIDVRNNAVRTTVQIGSDIGQVVSRKF